jgi:hypothetical protein
LWLGAAIIRLSCLTALAWANGRVPFTFAPGEEELKIGMRKAMEMIPGSERGEMSVSNPISEHRLVMARTE